MPPSAPLPLGRTRLPLRACLWMTACLWIAVGLLLPSAAEAQTSRKKAKAKPSTAPARQQATAAPRTALPAPLPIAAIPEIAEDCLELPLFADAGVVLDGQTGAVLYEKEGDALHYPASTTKIMTALLVIEEGNLNQLVEVTVEDSRVGESGLDIKPGDTFTRLQGLYGLMLKSANDVAHSLARDNAGTMEAFAVKMTRRARELGATNTSFMNPHGLHHPMHYTTARDLAIITRAAMQQPRFRQIVSARTFPWFAVSTGAREIYNHNRLLGNFPGCTGVKTGYTNPAQHCLASAALWDCREMIAAVMHSTKWGKWDDSKRLLTFGHTNPTPAGTPPPRQAVGLHRPSSGGSAP